MTHFSSVKIHAGLLNFVRPSDHSTFSPSAIDAWLACAYRRAAIEGIPEETSFYSEEGTLAHSVGEAMYALLEYDFPFSADLNMKLMQWDAQHGAKSPTSDMIQSAHGYVEVIRYWLNNHAEIGTVIWYGLERGVPIFPEEGCFGTGDCIIIGTKAAVVIDLKYGKGKKVSADSLQLKAYGAGIARHLIDIPQDYRIFSVVYQPRINAGAVSTSYTIPEMNHFLGDIWSAIMRTKEANLQPIEGNHCYWCPANRTKDLTKKCGAILDKPVKAAHKVFENFQRDMVAMNAPIDNLSAPNPNRDEALLRLMSIYPLVKEMYQNGMKEIEFRLKAGEAIQGVRLVHETGNRIYNAEDDAAIEELLKTKFPQVLAPRKIVPATTKLKSITEIEKEYKVKLDSICIKKVTQKVEILDDKMRSILGEMAAYGTMINNGQGQGEY